MRHKLIFSVVLGLLLISPATSYAKTVTWAGSLDITTLDPHGARDSFTLRFLGSIYEGLVAFGRTWNCYRRLPSGLPFSTAFGTGFICGGA